MDDTGKRALEASADPQAAPVHQPTQPPAKKGTTTISLVVPNELAGAIIGPRGTTLTSIRDTTGCRVSVETTPTPEHERLAQVTAPSVEVMHSGMEAVLDALQSAPSPATGISLLVEPASVGALIGKGGVIINDMRSSSGANIIVQDDTIRVLHTYARCDIQGEPTAIRSAVRLVSQRLFEHYSREGAPDQPDARALLLQAGQSMASAHSAAMMHPALHYHQPGAAGYGLPPPMPMPPYGMPMPSTMLLAPPANPAPAPSKGNHGLEMVVPKQFLGNIIGKGGKYINQVRGIYQVDVVVDDKVPLTYGHTNQPAAKITVMGPRDAVWLAAAKCVQNLNVGTNAQEADQPAIMETMYIEHALVPKVIGKGGSRINLIRTSSKCKIVISQPNGGSDGSPATCTLEGKPREIAGARMLLDAQEVMLSPPTTAPPVGVGVMHGSDPTAAAAVAAAAAVGVGVQISQPSLELIIPKRFLGLIIGRGGKYINSVRHSTACDIQVDDSSLAQAEDEPLASLTVTGGNLAMNWVAAGQLMSNLMVGKPSPEEGDAVKSEVMSFPAEQVGQLIGKSGQRINLIRQYSGCKVQLEQPQGEGGMAVVTLEGGTRQVLAARTLMTAREVKRSYNEDAAAGVMDGGVGGELLQDPVAQLLAQQQGAMFDQQPVMWGY